MGFIALTSLAFALMASAMPLARAEMVIPIHLGALLPWQLHWWHSLHTGCH